MNNNINNTLPSIKLYKKNGEKSFKKNKKRGSNTMPMRPRPYISHLTHLYLPGEDQPMCIAWQIRLPVKHILIECVHPMNDRNTIKKTIQRNYLKIFK